MNRPSLTEGVILAAGLAIITTPALILTSLFFVTFAAKVLVALLAFLYGSYVLVKAGSRAGKLVLGITSAAALALGTLVLSFPELVLIALGLMWLVRSLVTYNSILPAALDGLLCLLGLGAGIWAYAATYSTAAAVWCFFLIQALFVFIPPSLMKRKYSTALGGDTADNILHSEDNFSTAHRAAQEALNQLIVEAV
jgi:hypothetical protein